MDSASIWESLRSASGAGIRIALIDSGVNTEHSHVGSIAGGVTLGLDAQGRVQIEEGFRDYLGHGTALAGILRSKAPGAAIHVFKIFADRLVTSVDLLEAAMRRAIEQNMQIVNLSLGTANPEHRDRMLEVVALAKGSATLIVASSPPQQAEMLPAALDDVFGVAAEPACAWNEYRYIENDPIHFRAHPSPRPLPGLDQARNFRGHSFASAHLTALLALLIQNRPKLTFGEAREHLIALAGRPLPLASP